VDVDNIYSKCRLEGVVSDWNVYCNILRFNTFDSMYRCVKVKGKAIPVTDRGGP
jgi:hypothetical protein